MADYLVPTDNGARYTVAEAHLNPLRALLYGIIQSAGITTNDLEQFIDDQLFGSRKAVAAALYKLQGLGLIYTQESPVVLPQAAAIESLEHFLGQISSEGKALLADRNGFVMASHGFKNEAARELAAVGTDMTPMGARISGEMEQDVNAEQEIWELTINRKGDKITFMRLFIGSLPFLVAIGGQLNTKPNVFLQLMAILINRYLGMTDNN